MGRADCGGAFGDQPAVASGGWLMRAILLTAIAALFFAAQPAWTEPMRAILLADTLRLTNSNQLIAENNVQITYKGNRLSAKRVVYDQGLNHLTIEGPFTLDTGDQVVILADAAELDADLVNGIIRGALLVLNQRTQLAAAEIQRIDGRYRVLQNVAASSCNICASSDTPLWEIRATRVIHDEVEKQMYFDNARFRLAGVPIFYLPRLRLPDPTLTRATGFLRPTFAINSDVGLGIKIPYFITFGKHADLTITPFVTNKDSRSLSLGYRQAYSTGEILVTGTYTRDQVLGDDPRFYGLATGSFDLPRGYTLSFRAETVSDAAYFQSYGLTEKDRLVTFAQIQRTTHETTVNTRILGTQSIRASENNATLPSLMADTDWQHRYDLGQFGEANLALQAHARQRGSTSPLDGSDPDSHADGRDVLGYGLRANWQKNVTLPFGVLAALQGELRGDAYRVSQDSIYAGDYGRIHAAFGGELRWPLVKISSTGTSQTLEPIAQLVVTPTSSHRVFNEDSTLVEFDEGNLFSLNRFPGTEIVEDGARLNFGVNYSRDTAAGQHLAVSVGRVFRAKSMGQFSQGSGLNGVNSDWLLASQIDFGQMLTVTGRLLFDDNFVATKTDIRAARGGLSLGYLYVPADLAEDRTTSIGELSLISKHNLSQYWTATVASRYDFVSKNTAKGSLGLVYRNECLSVDVSLSRSFTSSTNVSPSTDFGLSVELLGFGAASAASPTQCRS
jgi:LPS-assembly protein